MVPANGYLGCAAATAQTALRRAGWPVEGGKNVVTRGLHFPATEEEALGTRWLQARRRRAFREQQDPANVREQLDSAFVGQQQDPANVREQLDSPNVRWEL
jgi:hypothetical protein